MESNALKNVYTKANRVEQWPLSASSPIPIPIPCPTLLCGSFNQRLGDCRLQTVDCRLEPVQTIACVDLFENCVRTNVALTQHFPIFMAWSTAESHESQLPVIQHGQQTLDSQTESQSHSHFPLLTFESKSPSMSVQLCAKSSAVSSCDLNSFQTRACAAAASCQLGQLPTWPLGQVAFIGVQEVVAHAFGKLPGMLQPGWRLSRQSFSVISAGSERRWSSQKTIQ